MSRQLTVRLSDQLSQALGEAAARMHRKRSEIVRIALLRFLGQGAGDERAPSSRVGALLGSLESGIPDLAEDHRTHILDALKNDG